eukprot:9098092-Pyramimonas_sp.AAC.1
MHRLRLLFSPSSRQLRRQRCLSRGRPWSSSSLRRPRRSRRPPTFTTSSRRLAIWGSASRRRDTTYDQAIEELVDAEEAHEAAVLAYNQLRSPTAPEVKQPASAPDFLA